MVITHFIALTDALTSSGWLFGSCEPELQCLSVGKFTAYFANVSCRSASNHAIRIIRLFFCLYGFFSRADWLRPRHRCRPHPGARVSAQGFAVTWLARPSYHTESSSSLGSLEPRSLRTGILLPVALHGRITPPQFLSTTGPVTLILTGTFTPLRCALSQSHQVTPLGLLAKPLWSQLLTSSFVGSPPNV